MRKRSLIGVVASAVMACAVPNLKAALIYSDNFDAAAGVLAGRAPTVSTGLDGGSASATWTSDATPSTNPDSVWTATGGTYSGVGSTSAVLGSSTTGADVNLITNAYLPFTPVTGTIYDFHLAINTSSVGASGNWIGMAFAIASLNGHTLGGVSSGLSNDGVYGLLIDKGTGTVQTFGGQGTANGETSPTVTPGIYNNFDLFLNTTGTSWTESWSVNGVPLAGVYTFTANPSIGNVIFGSNKITGSVSDFSLSDTSIPEPASLGLLALGGLLLPRRRTAR